MDLITLMLNKRIAGLEESVFEQVLMGTHESLGVKKSGQGILMLTNNAIVKCVSYYYKNTDNQDKKAKKSSDGLQCYNTQEALGVTGIDIYQCSICHLRCMQKRKRKELHRNNSLK